MQKRVAVLGSLACALALFAGARAEAAYNYTTTLSITSSSAGAGTIAPGGLSATFNGVTIAFSPEAGSKAVPSANTLNLGDFTVTVVSGTSNVSFSVSILDTISIANVSPPGTLSPPNGTLTFTDTVVLTGITNSGGLSGTVTDTGTVVGIGTTTAGGNTFTLSSLVPSPPNGFSSPTLNGAGGNFSLNIIATAPSVVPAPASLVMFGLGMGALGVIRLRRRSSRSA